MMPSPSRSLRSNSPEAREVEDPDINRHEDVHDAVSLGVLQEQHSGGTGKSRIWMWIGTNDHDAGLRGLSGATLRWLGEVEDLDIDRHE